MDSHDKDRIDDLAVAETPEDVAVLYSWANLHGAKYRDFSASRREYRAQLRHRAAQQVREQALLAQAEAETAAAAADAAQRYAVAAARTSRTDESDLSVQRALREAEEAARTAAAERVEAARRAEAAAVAEAAARREEREIAEAHASAQRQAARYADSEIRSRAGQPIVSALPGEISDPYTAHPQPQSQQSPSQSRLQDLSPSRPIQTKEAAFMDERRSNDRRITPDSAESSTAPVYPAQRTPVPQSPQRRPQGYRPDDASGVRQIYRGPDHEAPLAVKTAAELISQETPVQGTSVSAPHLEMKPMTKQPMPMQRTSTTVDDAPIASVWKRRTDGPLQPGFRSAEDDALVQAASGRQEHWSAPPADHPQSADRAFPPRETAGDASPSRQSVGSFPSPPAIVSPRAVSPFSQALAPSDSTRGRRAQDDFNYKQSPVSSERERRSTAEPPPSSPVNSTVNVPRAGYVAEPAGPAWLYASPVLTASPKPLVFQPPPPQSSVADTLQHSRERVAARWFALKGVFEQPGQEQAVAPVRQKETRTPVLAVFSLAGGVGKTSLVATVGRSLSSMGEKVLLTDTTSHGLLPFYFGASELRQGAVRTFSPPSGSTDAPIYLVSYDVNQTVTDDAAQDLLAEEIVNNSRGTHRILLDLTPSTSWIVRRMFRMNPTILVPLAPDMNSIISLQTVEKFFHGINDGDGRPLQPFYVLNQFDTSLPLHLDVREVLRRQLGERLLPFVIRRAPAVSEALAEGMTVVDYAPDAPVAEDYLNVATWLRTVAAPATAGFRNVRWSER
jgi:cellulose synthase operon protein YhjQ